MARFLGVLAILTAAAPHAAAQRASPETDVPALDAIRPGIIRAHVRFLSHDLLRGRAPGTPGGRLAELYVASQFERMGLEPAGEGGTWFQPVPLVGLTAQPSLVVGANRETVTLRWLDEFVAWPEVSRPAVSVDGEIVFVGHGIVAPEYGWDDYGPTPLTGRIALVLVNDPGLRDSTIFEGPRQTWYGRWTYKLEQAARMGAAGVILVHTEERATYPWSVVRGSWTGEQVALAERPDRSLQFAAWVTWEGAKRLLAPTGKDLDLMVRRAEQPGFRPIPTGAYAAVHIRSTVRRFEAANVVARLPGTDSAGRDEAVIFTAHLDHVGVGEPAGGDSIYNGAEDNASGVATILAVAEAYARAPARPRRSVLFLATTAEEAGLLGAEAWVADPRVPLHRTAAVLNIDVANLRGRTADITALGAAQSSLASLVASSARAESLVVSPDPEPGRGSFFRSDHFPFARAGVPVLSFRIGSTFPGHPDGWGREQAARYTRERYHRPTDEFSREFDFGGAVQQARVMARVGWTLARTAEFPQWLDGSAFRPAGRRLESLRTSR